MLEMHGMWTLNDFETGFLFFHVSFLHFLR